LSQGISDEARAQHEAIVAIGRLVKRQASIMGYGDTFFLLASALLLALVATVALHKPEDLGAGHPH
jgi:DHA2 family multidrug resistance protein